jgi:COMPASS component SWD1
VYLIGPWADRQEDETELSRRKDLEEDVDIDVLAADDTFPRKPQPYLPGKIARIALESTPADGVEESEEIRSVRLIMEAKEWADAEPDDDTWEGFFVSLDLNESLDEED